MRFNVFLAFVISVYFWCDHLSSLSFYLSLRHSRWLDCARSIFFLSFNAIDNISLRLYFCVSAWMFACMISQSHYSYLQYNGVFMNSFNNSYGREKGGEKRKETEKQVFKRELFLWFSSAFLSFFLSVWQYLSADYINKLFPRKYI